MTTVVRTVLHEPKYELKARGTGRTSRMLVEAYRMAYNGQDVYVVIHDKKILPYFVPLLRDLGAKISANNCSAIVGEGPKAARIWFISKSNEQVRGLSVKGVDPKRVFFDHKYVSDTYREVLEEYHKYDQ